MNINLLYTLVLLTGIIYFIFERVSKVILFLKDIQLIKQTETKDLDFMQKSEVNHFVELALTTASQTVTPAPLSGIPCNYYELSNYVTKPNVKHKNVIIETRRIKSSNQFLFLVDDKQALAVKINHKKLDLSKRKFRSITDKMLKSELANLKNFLTELQIKNPKNFNSLLSHGALNKVDAKNTRVGQLNLEELCLVEKIIPYQKKIFVFGKKSPLIPASENEKSELAIVKLKLHEAGYELLDCTLNDCMISDQDESFYLKEMYKKIYFNLLLISIIILVVVIFAFYYFHFS